MYICCTGSYSVAIIDASGIIISSFGSKGMKDGQFLQPKGICVDPEGKNVFVADSGNNRIAKWALQERQK